MSAFHPKYAPWPDINWFRTITEEQELRIWAAMKKSLPATANRATLGLPEEGHQMHDFTETPAQAATLDRLARQGWKVDHTDDDTAYLSKRGRFRGQTLYTQVGPDGLASHEN